MIIDKNVQSLEESVFFTLEEEILNGELSAGQTLTEVALSRRLGVSRTPLRSALHRLAEEGLISITPNRGAVVIGVTAEDLINIYKIRMRLEGLASAEAAINMSQEQKRALAESVELSRFYISKNDTEKLKELDSEFHNVIYRASSNKQLTRILSELHRNIRAYRKRSLSVPERIKKSIDEHEQILGAIMRSDAEEAERLTVLHVAAALENLLLVTNKS